MPPDETGENTTFEYEDKFKVSWKLTDKINLYNVGVTDKNLKLDLEAILKDNIYDIVPACTKLRNIKWDGKTLSAESLSAATPTTNISQPQFAEGVYLAGNYYYD